MKKTMRYCGNRMTRRRERKRLLQMLFVLAGLCFGLTIPEIQAEAAQSVASHGNLIYEEGSKSISLYAADILLLEEKISSIADRCFDPACYTHTHHWEYVQVNETTHTRHCAECGEAGDLTGVHRSESWESDTIYYEGKVYPGKRYTCACGYQWSMELHHNLIYETVDELSHRSRCALDETPYCPGCEPSVEEHYAWYYEMGEDELHHVKICYDCGFRTEEACRFDQSEVDGEEPNVCICGREAANTEESDLPQTEEAPEAPDEPEAKEKPEASDKPGTEEPEAPEKPGTEDEPAPDKPGIGEEPEAPDKPGTGDEPGTEDEAEKPGSEDASQEPGTGDEAKTPGSGDEPQEPGTGDETKSQTPVIDNMPDALWQQACRTQSNDKINGRFR